MKDKGKLLMMFFIGSEAFFFIALIIAYVYYRNFTNVTDVVSQNLNVTNAAILTVILVNSSFTLLWSKSRLKQQRYGQFKGGMFVTILLGLVFITGQVKEYIGLYQKNITMNSNVFGSSFFTLTGFHGLHVFIGLLVLAILLLLCIKKHNKVVNVAINGADLYWHFVDVVWLFVFFFVYLLPVL